MNSPYRYNPTAPHQAVLCLTIEVYEQNPLGQVTGIPISLEHTGTAIPKSKLYSFVGKNLEECKEKVLDFINRLEGKDNDEEEATERLDESET